MSGDESSELERLNRRFRPALMAYFMSRRALYVDAEDMTQEVFVRLANLRPQVLENIDAFVFRVASNLLKDRGRRLRTRTTAYNNLIALDNFDCETLDPARFYWGRESLGEVSTCLRELPDITRDIFVLYRIEGMDQTDLAKTFKISTRTVQKHVAKALAHLNSRLNGEGTRE